MEKVKETNAEILRMIVEEIEPAREVYQLFMQLRNALPIKNFKDLEKAADHEGKLHFRDTAVGFRFFESYIPNFIFPIEDEKALIERLGQFVKIFPQEIGYDRSNGEYIKRMNQTKFLSSLLTTRAQGSFAAISTAGFTDTKGVQDFIKVHMPQKD